MAMRAMDECGWHAARLDYVGKLVQLGQKRSADYKAAMAAGLRPEGHRIESER